MIDHQRIAKECFWDLSIEADQLEDIIKGNEKRKKQMLFEKILLNSTKLFADLSIFDKEELAQLLRDFKIPQFNAEYSFRRKNIAEVYFFDKPLQIDELRWIA